MKGARSAQSRPYWIRYVVAFCAAEKLKWAKDNVLVACVCSLAPGLIAAIISAAISDHKWRAATYATLLTYGGLFALFLTWRLIATPWELDRERQRFIDGLTQKLADTRLELVQRFAWQFQSRGFCGRHPGLGSSHREKSDRSRNDVSLHSCPANEACARTRTTRSTGRGMGSFLCRWGA